VNVANSNISANNQMGSSIVCIITQTHKSNL
jgi:hypothetical protein